MCVCMCVCMSNLLCVCVCVNVAFRNIVSINMCLSCCVKTLCMFADTCSIIHSVCVCVCDCVMISILYSVALSYNITVFEIINK